MCTSCHTFKKTLYCPLFMLHPGWHLHIQKEYAWLESVRHAVSGEFEDGQYISWSAYHASHQSGIVCPKGSTELLPLFEDSAHSCAMIRHPTTITMAVIHHLNPGQIPVLTCDQPLYAIQCTTPRPTLPDPTSWGWTLEGTTYRPFWTTQPDAAKSCLELVRCSCKKGCSTRCNCVKATLQCTALCACDGQCVRDSTT